MGAFESGAANVTAFSVLVVDDNAQFRALIGAQLGNMGCRVHTVATASDFLSALITSKMHFDMAVIDLNLPDLRGDQILSWLGESEEISINMLPVLLVTGMPQLVSDSPLLDRRNVHLLAKPYRLAELERAVSGLLLCGTQH